MIIPIRCFSCNKLIADKWKQYEARLQEEFDKLVADYQTRNIITDVQKSTIENQVLDELNLTRYCCRRMFLTNVDLCEKI